MNADFTTSVVLITSQDLKNGGSGSGFVFHRDAHGTYLLTCAHVVDSVGGVDAVSLYGQPAEVIAMGVAAFCDLAVLRVAGLFERAPLLLCVAGTPDAAFETAGFLWFANNFLIRPLHGHLGASCGIELPDQETRIAVWDLLLDDPNFDIQPGYSGSPVVHQERGCVVGVVSYRIGERKSLALSIEALRALWPAMPLELLASSAPPSSPSAPRTTFAAIKRQTLEADLADLCKKYEAARAQIRNSLSAVDKITLQNQVRQLEQEIQARESELNQLGSS